MQSRPYGLFWFGVFSLFLALAGTFTGEAFARFGRVIYRSEEPRDFWEVIVSCYLIGVGLIGYFLYCVYWR